MLLVSLLSLPINPRAAQYSFSFAIEAAPSGAVVSIEAKAWPHYLAAVGTLLFHFFTFSLSYV